MQIGEIGSAVTLAANAFTTGSRSGGYTLASVTAAFADDSGAPGAIEVAIHADSSGSPADTAQVTLSGSNPTTEGTYTYTCSGSCALSASTTYFLVISAASTGQPDYYQWKNTLADTETLTPSGNGWQIANKAKAKGVGSWQDIAEDAAGMFQVVAN